MLLLLATLLAQAPFDSLKFRNIGPATPSGRIDDFAVLESNPAVFYVASATGGLWKTVNMGTTFEPVFDGQGSSSIGDVAIAPTDANLVWVGTGENNNRQSSSWGDGVYKSTDGGKTWANMGLRESKQVARILVDPVDHDVVYVAALGDLWKGGGERGVYKTTDGGLTWTRVLDGGADVGATELVMDPANNKVLYAALYQRRRAVLGHERRRPGQRDLEIHRRRPHLDPAHQGTPRRAARPHRPRRLPEKSQHPLRPHRAREGERRLSLRRRRRELEQGERHQSAADVLQPDPDRPRQREPDLRPRHLPPPLG